MYTQHFNDPSWNEKKHCNLIGIINIRYIQIEFVVQTNPFHYYGWWIPTKYRWVFFHNGFNRVSFRPKWSLQIIFSGVAKKRNGAPNNLTIKERRDFLSFVHSQTRWLPNIWYFRTSLQLVCFKQSFDYHLHHHRLSRQINKWRFSLKQPTKLLLL